MVWRQFKIRTESWTVTLLGVNRTPLPVLFLPHGIPISQFRVGWYAKLRYSRLQLIIGLVELNASFPPLGCDSARSPCQKNGRHILLSTGVFSVAIQLNISRG